uniref:Uncharacterized protein n=1 Tax=Palpitomonas bilix TaxID=652834 RepID=A0A7S3D2K5_9EUKA|mmetsp:Transcript_17421/g.43425  ORF Transcript_17421/g.43425 Transcript_17421/m.43425 type:complete len:135 (+) Transcript_17421:195-599(+)|eukprot:CAMPEP_0113867808 /NCGR_PEP_ID=MMETSP0780_2-20120614/628_1 /TAXON_ID=652834 /ORGANISM="Palpitomonas bilix" /LENGTH=134 /DNA_ID=CAMNT_0000852799 /DNA_START=120 /DNA_END=524 /DNA_ORIENTATION=- /assembly_acc=CAM_ASM_000599
MGSVEECLQLGDRAVQCLEWAKLSIDSLAQVEAEAAKNFGPATQSFYKEVQALHKDYLQAIATARPVVPAGQNVEAAKEKIVLHTYRSELAASHLRKIRSITAEALDACKAEKQKTEPSVLPTSADYGSTVVIP